MTRPSLIVSATTVPSVRETAGGGLHPQTVRTIVAAGDEIRIDPHHLSSGRVEETSCERAERCSERVEVRWD